LKVLYLGDLVGRSGRDAAIARLPELRERLKIDFTVVNGENAAAGFGITAKICDELFDAGTDAIVTGNHVWDNRDILAHFQRENRLLRPLNFPAGTAGRGIGVYDVPGGRRICVAQVMGRVFMDAMDCPFRGIDAALKPYPLGGAVNFTLVDIHAEATSEKMAMGHYLDGRASMVVGTHTHVPTADCQILNDGTAYMTDVGMCGDFDSVIGMKKEEPIRRFIQKTPGQRFGPADGEGTVCGVFVESDDKTGKALRIEPVRVGPRLAETIPEVA